MTEKGEWYEDPGARAMTETAFRERFATNELLELGNGSIGVITEVDVAGRRYRVDWIQRGSNGLIAA